MKKLITLLSIILLSLFTFSSCSIFVPIINKDNATERINTVQPEKQLNRTVVLSNSIFVNVNGEQKEHDILSEVKKYYTVNEEASYISKSIYLYENWMYYTYVYDYDENNAENFSLLYKMNVAFMRTDIYTGETENIADLGMTYGRVYDFEVYDGRYYFLYAQGLLKIYDLSTNQFTYEQRIATNEEIELENNQKSSLHKYCFASYNGSLDYVDNGEYYHYNNGTYEKLSVPDWVTEKDGSINDPSTDINVCENYLYTQVYKDVEEERKAFDLETGVEVDYMTVVKPLRESKPSYVATYADEGILQYNDPILIKTEEKDYQIRYSNGSYGTPSELNQSEHDKNGEYIDNTEFTINEEYLKSHSNALQRLCNLWYQYKEGSLTIERLAVSQNRAFFTCYIYYGNFFYGTYSKEFLCELDPVTGEVYYLGYYDYPYENGINAIFVHEAR